MNPILTHVQEEASDSTLITRLHQTKMFEECVPMVDKTIDVGPKEKQAAPRNSFGSKGENKFILQIRIFWFHLYWMSNILSILSSTH